MQRSIPPDISREAKALVALALRNGPIENLHAGKLCPTCAGSPEYSHVTNQEMKEIMTNAVTWIATYLWLKENDPPKYEESISFGETYTRGWDEPVLMYDPKRRHFVHMDLDENTGEAKRAHTQ